MPRKPTKSAPAPCGPSPAFSAPLPVPIADRSSRSRAGEVPSRSFGGVVALEAALSTMVISALVPLLEVVHSVCVLFYLNVWLGLIGSLVCALAFLGPRIFATWAFALGYDKRRR